MVVALWTSIMRNIMLQSVPILSVAKLTYVLWQRSASKRLSGSASILLVCRGWERLAKQPIGVPRGHFLDDGQWHAFELCDFFCHPCHQRRGGTLPHKLATIGPGTVALQEQIVEGHALHELAVTLTITDLRGHREEISPLT